MRTLSLRAAWLLSAVLVFGLNSATARPHQPIDSVDALDEQIGLCLEYLAEGRIDEARLLARQLAWRFPDFPLGQLISAELEAVAAFDDVSIADHLPMAQTVSELLLEAQRRLAASRGAQTSIPGDLLQIGNGLSQVVVVDLQSSVLYHYETGNRQPVLTRQHYIGSGESGFGKRLEGDLKTPLGVYSITGLRSDASLPDLYGAGALTLDYPNTLDQLLGRTGYGIWLHGVPPSQLSRTPYSSEGCVTMSNEHFTRLSDELDVSQARVILTNNADPLPLQERNKLQRTFRGLFRRYQQAWIDGDRLQLMSLYNDQDQFLERLSTDRYGFMRVSNNDDLPESEANPYEHLLYRKSFSAIQPTDISIFRTQDVDVDSLTNSNGIMINAIFGASNEHEITIYWTQNDRGQWRVLAETLQGSGL